MFGSLEIRNRLRGLFLSPLHKTGYQFDGKAHIVSVPVEDDFSRCEKSHDLSEALVLFRRRRRSPNLVLLLRRRRVLLVYRSQQSEGSHPDIEYGERDRNPAFKMCERNVPVFNRLVFFLSVVPADEPLMAKEREP